MSEAMLTVFRSKARLDGRLEAMELHVRFFVLYCHPYLLDYRHLPRLILVCWILFRGFQVRMGQDGYEEAVRDIMDTAKASSSLSFSSTLLDRQYEYAAQHIVREQDIRKKEKY